MFTDPSAPAVGAPSDRGRLPADSPVPAPRARRLRVAVVGYGYWGAKHVRVLSSIPGTDVAVVDAAPLRRREAAARHPAVRLAADLGELVDDVDAVVVATPPGSHAAIAAGALAAGKHVLVEKPLTTSVADAEALIDLAARQCVQLMVGHTFEYHAAVHALRELVRSGALGRVLYIDSARLALGRYQRDVNVIWDLAPHDISIVSYVLDDLPASTSVWSQRHIATGHDDVARVRLDFERSGTQAHVHVIWLSPQRVRRVTIVGERRMAVYDDLADGERIRVYDVGVDVRSADDPSTADAAPVSYRTGDVVSPHMALDEPLLVQDQHFLDCVRTGCRPRTPGERGLDVVRVLAATDVARSSGRPAPVLVADRPIEVSAGPLPGAGAARLAAVPLAAS